MDTQFITNSVLIIGILAMGWDRWRSGSSATAKETIDILKESLSAKDVKIAEMKAAHDAAIAALHVELKTLQAQMEHMRETNIILTNTVTGKETLLAITDILKPLPTLFIPGGFIDEVRINQQNMLKNLSEIREAMNHSKVIETPEDRHFEKRSQPPE